MTIIDLGELATTAVRANGGSITRAIADVARIVESMRSSGLSAGRWSEALNELRSIATVSR